jgi:Zn-finger nucleic acid-binding protein
MTVGTKSLSCRKCGGVLKCVDNHNAYRCEYCHSICVVSEVPLLVDGIQPVNDVINSPCPACSETLLTAQLDSRPILYCPGCYGMLVRREHFGAIVNERRSKRVGLEQESPRPIDPTAYARRLRCPSCECNMEAHPYYGPGNIVIDSCSECGYVWLDHGELSRVERSTGGREPATIHLPVDFSGYSGSSQQQDIAERHPIAILADFLF